MTAVKAYQVFSRSRVSDTEHGVVDKSATNTRQFLGQGLNSNFLSLQTLPRQSSDISAFFWINFFLYTAAVAVLWFCCLVLC